MNRIVMAFILSVLLTVGLSAGSGKIWQISVRKARVLQSPDMLANSLGELKENDTVEILETRGGFHLIRTVSGLKGYISASALAESKSKGLGTALASGKSTPSQAEISGAAKGWNESTEKKMKGEAGYNFADMEWVLKQGLPIPVLKKFRQEGNLK